MKTNKILFEAFDPYIYNVGIKPYPAIKGMPDWWKNISKYVNPEFVDVPNPVVTVKACAPSLDMLGAGYIIPLWGDFLVQKDKNEKLTVTTQTDKNYIFSMDSWNPLQSSTYEVPNGFNKKVFKYHHGWKIKTPPGWSTLFIHPEGYQNLPIRSIGGIVDTDMFDAEINCPFFIKDGFSGIIKKGTPMVQAIPFKREDWYAEYSVAKDPDETYYNKEKVKTKFYGYYSSLRSKKKYQ